MRVLKITHILIRIYIGPKHGEVSAAVFMETTGTKIQTTKGIKWVGTQQLLVVARHGPRMYPCCIVLNNKAQQNNKADLLSGVVLECKVWDLPWNLSNECSVIQTGQDLFEWKSRGENGLILPVCFVVLHMQTDQHQGRPLAQADNNAGGATNPQGI